MAELQEQKIKHLKGGELTVPSGFHFVINIAEGAKIHVKKGGKLTLRLSLNCTIDAEEDADVK